MGKKKKTLISLIFVLLILTGVLYLVSRPTESEAIKEVDEIISLTDFSYGDIKAITIDVLEDEAFTFTKSDNNWMVKGSSVDYKLNQMAINKAIRKLVELKALSRLEEETPDDLAPYGLDNPTIIKTDLEDNGVKQLAIGNKTIRDSYYVMVNNDPSIYEVDLETGIALTATLNMYRIKDIMLPVDTMTLKQLIIKRENNDTIEMELIEGYSDESGARSTASHKLIQPFEQKRDVNGDRIEGLFTTLNSLTIATDIIEDYPQDLGLYGLAEPKIEIVIKDDKQDLTLLIGDVVSENENLVYLMPLGSNTVYTVSGEAILYMESVEAYDLIFHFIMLINIDKVDQIIINNNNEEYILEINRELSDKDGKTDSVDTYFINNKELSVDSFIAIYQLLIGLSSDAVAQESTDIDDSVISIEYINKTEGTISRVDLVPYNEFFYGAYANGDYRFVVSKEALEEIINEMDGILLD